MSSPIKIYNLNENISKKLQIAYPTVKEGFVQVGEGKHIIKSTYKNYADDYYNFKLRSDDIWIVTTPRSGTTVLQEMIWQLTHDLDFNAVKNQTLDNRVPFFESDSHLNDEFVKNLIEHYKDDRSKDFAINEFLKSKIEHLNNMASPRVIKTHLPFSLLNPNLLNTCKVVYMTRNPKDLAVSFYYQHRLLRSNGYKGDFKSYWDLFQQNIFPRGPYWEHVTEAWKYTEHPNLIFLFYEDLVKDMKGTIQKVGNHINKQLADIQLNSLTDFLHIDNFRKVYKYNEKLDYLFVEGEQGFVRKGKNKGWVDHFTPEMNKNADLWIKENIIKLPNFKFPEI